MKKKLKYSPVKNSRIELIMDRTFIDMIQTDISNEVLRQRLIDALLELYRGNVDPFNSLRAECNISMKTSERFAISMMIAFYSMKSKILANSQTPILRQYLFQINNHQMPLQELMDETYQFHKFRYNPRLSPMANCELAFDAAVNVLTLEALSHICDC